MKLKYEDLIRLNKYLEEHCKMSPVFVNINDRNTAIIFNVTNTKSEKLSITLYDEQYYMNPKIVKEEDL